MNVDMSQTIIPRSDQLNAEDLLTGPRTVTITEVRRGSAEQPVDIHLAEFDRPFKPCKTARRILVAAWGVNAASYVGRRMTIYRDPAVKFGGMDVGGIRISHLSHIDKRMTVALTVTRGKRAPYVVEPLATPADRTQQRANAQPPLPGEDTDNITKPQMAKMQALFAEAGITTPEGKRDYCTQQLGRTITSVGQLSTNDARKVIDALMTPSEPRADEDGWPVEEPPEGVGISRD